MPLFCIGRPMTSSGMSIIASRWHSLQRTAAILALFSALGPGLTGIASADKKPAQYEAQLKQLRSEISNLDKALAADKRDRDSLSARIRDEEQKLAIAAREAREARERVTEQEKQVAATDASLKASREAVEQGRRDLATALRATYMAGNPGPLQMLFQAEQSTSLQRLEADTTAVARAVQRRLDALRQRVVELDQARLQLEAQREILAQRSVALTAAQKKLEAAQADRKRRLAKLKKRAVERSSELASARAEQAKIEQLLEKLRTVISNSPINFEKGKPFTSLKGRLPWPSPGKLQARFGSLKGGGPLTWNGWWIQSPEGGPVQAVADGRVVYVGWVQRYGLLVILDHPGPYLTLYGHVQESAVEVGDVVSAGARIASTGTSGGHEISGVYFEIRQGTTAVDPAKWLSK